MYYFPDLDEQTRLNMISELEFDIRTGLFYEPLSMTASGMMTYKRLLKECFENDTPATLQQKLTSSFFKEKDLNGRKISSNIRETIAFSDFNAVCFVLALLMKHHPYNNFEQQLKELFTKYPKVDITKMGFPKSYKYVL